MINPRLEIRLHYGLNNNLQKVDWICIQNIKTLHIAIKLLFFSLAEEL